MFDPIVVSEATNQIIATGSAAEIEYIAGLIRELDSQVITTTIPLKRLKAATVMPQIARLASKPENITADPEGNRLIIRDNSNNVEQIDQLDAEDAYFTRTFHLQHAPASSVAQVIETFLSRQRPQQTRSAADRGAGAAGKEAASTPAPSPAARGATPPAAASPATGPGLAGVRTPTPAATAAATPPPAPAGAGPAAATAEESSQSLGTAGTVVADDRSNTVTITETLALLTKIEQLIGDLDVPVQAYSYTVQCRQLDTTMLDKMVPSFLRPDEDSYFLDPQNRGIHFTTIPSMAERLTAVLKEWDRPVRQVLIRAKILTVSTSTLRDIGVSFKTVLDIENAQLTAQGSLPSQVGDRSGSLTLQKLTDTQFEIMIKAIETDNRSRILANPRILAMDNNAAEVRTATDEPFNETSIDSVSGSTIQNVRFLQVGTVLRVTPQIKEDRTIEMKIDLDVSSLEEIRNGIPVVKRNIASSDVTVKDNHVLMIGGLRSSRDMKVQEKIPILGDIPLLGLLFRSERTERQDTELILFLQPTLVDTAEGTETPPDPNELKDCL
jgi:type II secretory pathway component GspD/PulD (secretin)